MNITQKRIYDICIIGSGAAGGFAAKELTAAGADTILLEAGTKGRLEDLYIHDAPYELPKRGFGLFKQATLYPDDIRNAIAFRGERVGIDRIRTLGGRTFHWNAASFRFSADDFRERSLFGIEEDWPLSYEELAPFYSYVEREMHVFGTKENLPHLPDGNFVAESPALRCSERYAQTRLAKRGIKLIPTRKAVLLKGSAGSKQAGRGACHFCGHCMDVCDARAVWSSDITVIPEALATGKLTLRMNALARQVLVDKEGKASGVSIIDRVTGKEEEIRARVIVLACASVESARLLLNSKSEKFPNGLANNNDIVGRYLTGHINYSTMGFVKDLVGKETFAGDGATDHAYIPRFNHLSTWRGGQKKSYVGGWGMQLNYHHWDSFPHAKQVAGFGSAYKQRVRELQPAMFQVGGWGKVEARASNRVTVDPAKTDKHGIPIPIIEFQWSENDLALFKEMTDSIFEVFEACGTDLILPNEVKPGGFASHETGTIRMGKDPKTSVLNSYCQAHEVKNLFAVDGSSFTTFSEKNPTLTIAALSVRASRYIAEQKKKRNL